MSRLCCLWLLSLFVLTGVEARSAEQPNILFLFADDLCFEQVHALGHDTAIQTPHLDRLAARGTVFTHCYNMGSYSGAVCVASRTMLNSGRTVWRAESIYAQSEQERQAGRWWSEYLKRAGYHTSLTGKWHCKASPEQSFDVVQDLRPGMPETVPEAYDRPVAGQPDVWSASDHTLGGYWQGGKHWSEVVADHAIDFLRDAAKRDQPCFHYVAFNAPHDPRQSPQEYLDRYPVESMAVPINFQPQYPYKDSIGCGPGLRDEKLAPFPRTELAVRTHRREYYSLITHLDAQIGRILDELDERPSKRPTWIFFTADHGLAVGQHGLFGKQNLYDHSVRVPFMVVGPQAPVGKQNNSPIYLQDVMPTTLELAGVPRPEHVEFQSLLPILTGERESLVTSVYGGYLKFQRSVTHNGWKLIVYPKAGVARLYHVADDPYEQRDLATEPENRPRMKSLMAELQKLQSQYDDPVDLTATFSQLQ